MLSWADEVTAPATSRVADADNAEGCAKLAHGDLLELYCGNGNIGIAIAKNFRRCFAIELAPELVSLAHKNAQLNGFTNFVVGVASAQEVSNALQTGSKVASLPELEIEAVSTILVDPPREGLDDLTCKMLARFNIIVYISCCPETLARDVSALSGTHTVTHMAIFDQFAYTDHLEMGLMLQRSR